MSGTDETPNEAAPTQTEVKQAPPVRRRPSYARRFLRTILLVVIPVIAIIGGLMIYMSTGRYVETENAYVKSKLHTLSSELDGRVTKVFVKENDRVKKGQLLVELDPEPTKITLAATEAAYQVARQQLRTRQAAYREAGIEIELAREAIRFHARQHNRYRHLRGKGMDSAMRLDESEHELKKAKQQLRAAQEKRKIILTELDGRLSDDLKDHPVLRQMQTNIAAARLDLGRTKIIAPSDGVMAKIKPEPGEVIEAQKPIGLLVEDGNIWIEANLKETQLTHIKIGQDATFSVDAYPDLEWQAKVSSIAPATGAEFALLPAQNASGNWVKVVQRLPVRLKVLNVKKRDSSSKRPELRAGMTVSIAIDTERSRQLPSFVSQFFAYADRVKN